ncbi:glycosyltransferase family 2 protein [Flavobacterium rhizosphaerae]|uniref:Glycosyltransferase n=1 Tax=Flavobacterium rhizosphaerae TaxID=3163298 RepID=A0ABW8Z0T5_9FLAO
MISIIIPTYKRLEMLKCCLDCLSYSVQGLAKGIYEIIVSDDSPDDTTKVMLENFYPEVQYNKGPKKGPAANRNSGAAFSQNEWIMFIDDDCIPDKNLVKNYIKAIEKNLDVKAFEGAIKADRPQRHFLEESPINLNGGHMWSCNILIQRDFFLSINGFDEDFPFAAMEDVDLHTRILKLKEKVIFVKDAIVIHPWRMQHDIAKMLKKRAVSREFFYKKHPELPLPDTSIKAYLSFYASTILKNFIAFRGRGAFKLIRAKHVALKHLRESLKN